MNYREKNALAKVARAINRGIESGIIAAGCLVSDINSLAIGKKTLNRAVNMGVISLADSVTDVRDRGLK